MIYSYAAQGYDGSLVKLEVELRRAIPGFDMVGLADNAVKESKERVRAAILQAGYEFPKERVLINLSPAGIPKVGASYDLAIAAVILQQSGQLKAFPSNCLIMGELGLDGSVKPVKSILSALQKAGEAGIESAIIPKANSRDGSFSALKELKAVSHLCDLVDYAAIDSIVSSEIPLSAEQREPGIDQIKGQQILKRVLSIAAAGKHHCLLFGPPGSGKTLGAHCLSSLLPPLTSDEFLEVSRIWSQSSLRNQAFQSHRPFREPHHSASAEGILGGSSEVTPGEISLAHCGILLMDEAPEYNNRVLQGLREPLETGKISLVRAGKSFWFPANFQLVLTANPCGCGNLGRKSNPCICSKRELESYWKSLRGPLMDRIDLRLPLEPVETSVLIQPEASTEAQYKELISNARVIQEKRFGNKTFKNGTMSIKDIGTHCSTTEEGSEILKTASHALGLSSRACHSVLKVSRTIADMSGEDKINREHILEAVNYRRYGETNLYWKKL